MTDNIRNSSVNVRDDWWHVVAAMPLYFPIAILCILFLGINPYIFQIALAILFPYSLNKDIKYVSSMNDNWKPNKYVYSFLGIITLLSFGTLSIVVSPYYIYKRKKYIG